MSTEKRQFGDAGEALVAEFLKKRGYKILERNWRQKCGELDIVAAKTGGLLSQKIKEIIFVEVKTAKGEGGERDAALAAQNVHYRKQRRLIRTAQIYLAQKKILPEVSWQIDVALVIWQSASGRVKIEYLEKAVWGK